ncbi:MULTISPECIES: helix-turn-helix domain-containing protein [Corynebacterium]|jgi:hypothetical protein|uniref:helix-turn-helix domain-containing protein n=2 Tax=Corynebacteriaceae TaxID=1653 RepID=UPI0003B7E7D2|nr:MULTISPECIES: helix-turn-helix transcriptional regulator [Corynebacterium]ERS55348.1 hypothetical protein HMPREF1267_00663 [Corynebacterium sp. KPL1824]ERS61359.1 hypothetical protein HMPREF1261_01038 [Corynebacterium sp. KPL1818]MDK4207964.1 helix-turn-helix transcriptional regulator [Corynebacterium accolens]MDK4233056.1 helix-turn-helix transcriptional regulator [Corynebacterium accolens]MDK4269756.1 helix-turn-helix transcriptional regulator [Corynebacterium accolens]
MIVSFIQLMWSSYGYGFSQQLRRVRERRGVSQQVLADISGVSRSQISNLERNENGLHTMADPQLSTVYKLALALEIPPAVLLPAGGDVVEGHLADSAVLGVEDVAPFPQDYINQRRFSDARG